MCCCASSGDVFEKYWSILLNISLAMLRCCKRMRVFPGLMICPSSKRSRSVLKNVFVAVKVGNTLCIGALCPGSVVK